MILPFVRELFADVEKAPDFQRAASQVKSGTGRIRVSGLTPNARALHYALLLKATLKPLIIVVNNNRAAEELLPIVQAFCDLTGAAHPDAVVMLPAYDVLPYENLSPHAEIQEARAAALWKIVSGAARIVIAPFVATAMHYRPAEFYFDLTKVINRGNSVDADELRGVLNTSGYSAVDVVEMPGEYALRGGILDIYPPETESPVRIELFGDEVESIRRFDTETQRSAAALDEVVLLPLSDTPVREDILGAIHAKLSGRRVEGDEQMLEDIARAEGVTVFPGWEYYAAATADQRLFDLMPTAAVLRDDPNKIETDFEAWWERVQQSHERSGVGNLVRPEELVDAPEAWSERITKLHGADLEQLGMFSESAEEAIEIRSQSTSRFHGSVPAMVEEVKALLADGRRVFFSTANTGEVERLADVFNEYTVPFRIGSRSARPGHEAFVEESGFVAEDFSAVTVAKAYVPEGVALPDSRLVIFGTRDLFDESEVSAQQPKRSRSKVSAFLSDFRDLAVNDYVVHVEHGIGQYQGLKEIAQGDGETTEFMILEYAEGARLYVPLTRLDLIQKYRSSEGVKPVLSRLGTQQWAKTKARVKKAMQDMADELLKLYAVRKTAHGHAFSPDGQFQREFADAFEFNETDDQSNAITDVYRDMESDTPMDRLLCGDVGYGKTEVSMRAAFKAVADNKQVAVLAPTTVLAFQHFETFKGRFSAFPVKVEMLSRFRTAKQQKEIVEKVNNGQVDILIGTHRVLSKDIKFPDLGLVVIDEEQRFGVRHKERLKQLRKEVDVLTMSATPIPRTLHMSLLGLRDMSVIETPPKDRIAIQTVVAKWDEKLIKSAIEQELDRGGQVYFVHNRVDSIYEISDKLRELVPKARILVGHGQIGEGELEDIMLKFMRHEADVLVATTIIENGLDIPLCNTMIVNRADRHGLSELYQLRGRVGRSNRRAYAYLLVPPDRELTELARRRLAALKEFSDLGAGFKIAALDLELRGAGNLLGGEQSGQIEAVGFELYTTMLERTVREMKGEVQEEQAETQLNLGLNIRIPPEYIQEENQRLRMYKRIAGVEDETKLNDVAAEVHDRYGAPPAPVKNLVEYARLRLIAERIGVAGIDRQRDQISMRFTEKAHIDPEKLAKFVGRTKGAKFTPNGILKFTLKAVGADEVLRGLHTLLQQLSEAAVSTM
ncbi:MAG TPA: transcription-repair coupling factor [Candidatus Koribacter sp.]|jgi:transcription-repair coupling factor (superfamily II helicase)